MLRVNKAMCLLSGRGCEELVGRSILEFTHPDDVKRSIDWSDGKTRQHADAPLLKRYVRPDGSIVEALVTTALVEVDGAEPYFFSQLQDVSEQRSVERQKAAIADLGRCALECTDVVTLLGETVQIVREVLGTANCITARLQASGEVRVVAAEGVTIDVPIPAGRSSQTSYTLRGRDPVLSNDLPGETRFSVPQTVLENGLHRGLSVPVRQRSGALHVILVNRMLDARPFTVQDAHFLQAVAHVIAGALDRAATEDELRRRAMEDPLTGLANRALAASQLEVELRHARRLGDRVCIMVLDLDRFKAVNDTLGHSAGDTLLRKAAARLSACVRDEDLVARPGGDEFTVVCTRTGTDHAITEVAQRVVDALSEPFEIDGHDVFISASVGVTVSEHGHETSEELFRDADAAMYRAKELGGGRFEAFDIALRHRLIERMMGRPGRPRANWQPGSNEGQRAAGSSRSGRPALSTGSARSSEAHTNCQQRFVLRARRYEARSLRLGRQAAPASALQAPRSSCQGVTARCYRRVLEDLRVLVAREDSAAAEAEVQRSTGWGRLDTRAMCRARRSRLRCMGSRSRRRWRESPATMSA